MVSVVLSPLMKAVILVLCIVLPAQGQDIVFTNDLLNTDIKTVTSIIGEYHIDYYQKGSTTIIDRRETIKEWMDRDHVREEIMEEDLQNKKFTSKVLLLLSEKKRYFFNAMTKDMVIDSKALEAPSSFINPLYYSWNFLSKISGEDESDAFLPYIRSDSFMKNLIKGVTISIPKQNELLISTPPAFGRSFAMKFSPDDNRVPVSVDAFGTVIVSRTDGTVKPKRETYKSANYLVTAKSLVTINGHAYSYPTAIDWTSGTVALLCKISVVQFKINDVLDEDLFTPDLSLADHVTDYTTASVTK